MLHQNETHPQRPDIDAILEAIAHLELAAAALDRQTAHLRHLPDDKRDRLQARIRDDHSLIFELYSRACEYLAQILRPDILLTD